MSDWTVEDQQHAEIQRLEAEVFRLTRRYNGLQKKSKAQSRTISKLSQLLRDKDRKLEYMNKPSRVRKGKRT